MLDPIHAMGFMDWLTKTNQDNGGNNMMTRLQIAKGVMAHATEHYEDGWDAVVECFTPVDLIMFWDSVNYHPRTINGAIKWQKKKEDHRNAVAADIVAAGE
jgi:hypothetical protein